MFRSPNDVTIPAKRQIEDETASSYYLCNFCSEGWSSETEVELHRDDCHKDAISELLRSKTQHICKMCVMEFESKDAMIRHIKSEHLLSSETATRVEREIFICDTCGDIFFNKLLLTHHMVHAHQKQDRNYRFMCPNCYKMVRITNSWYHFRVHSLQSISSCKICCVKFKDRCQLREHIKTHPRYYKCDLCGYFTKREENFNTHINTIHKKRNQITNLEQNQSRWKSFYMPRDYPYKWKKYNLMGWRGVKLTNNVHICVLCREICLDNDSMIRHILIEHYDKEMSVLTHMCSCGMTFTNKLLLRHHKFKFRKVHEK
ncbi:zinc finger Y-chromosomal protein 2-like [Epargyreus clarus]|uniref:zinc finger Y-chromosomal protein 2-like n=1 Tax=Epargyreus clarus TaxID=520877 RepID=UPI003C2BD215